MVLDGLCGVAIGTNAEGVLAVDLEQVGGFVQKIGDRLVFHGRVQNDDDIRLNKLELERKPESKTEFPADARGDLEAAGTGTGRHQTRSGEVKLKSSITSRRFGNVRGLRPFLALRDLELHDISFLQAFVALRGDSAVMHEHIGSTIAPDEAVTFRVVKPFHRTFQTFHVRPLRQASFTKSLLGGVKVLPAESATHCPAGGRGCQGNTSQKALSMCLLSFR